MKIISVFRHSDFYRCFCMPDDSSRGRRIVVGSTVLHSIIAQLTTGLFYTGFLVGWGINIVNIGIITFIPYLANMFGIFAPMLLSRFKRRKLLLFFFRLCYYTVGILGLTLLPILVQNPGMRVVGMIIIVFISNIFWALSQPGYDTWHISFIPNDIRALYLSVSMFFSSLIPGIMLLASGALTDMLAGSPYQMTVITVLRYISYGVALINCLILLLPREPSYEDKPAGFRISDIFTIPLQNRRYILTLLIIFIWQLTSSPYSTALTVFLLNDIKVSYFFYNMIIAVYSLFIMVLSPFWMKLIRRYSWLSVYALSLFLYFPTQVAFCFITPNNYIWLMLTVRLLQHFIGVGQNMCLANLQYYNLPEENRTAYMAFYIMTVNLGFFLGLAAGTFYTARTEGMSFDVFGFQMGNVPFLMLVTSFMQLGLAVYVYLMRYKLRPVAEI